MILKKIFLTVILLLSAMPLFANDTQRVHLAFTGDVMGHDAQISGAYVESTKQYDYTHCFQYVKPIISQADLAVANLEVTFGGAPYKGYPQFSSPDALAYGLKEAGFDVLMTANNHACDRYEKGLIRTIQVMEKAGFLHTGTFRSRQEKNKKYPLLVKKNNIRFAFLNATYGTNEIYVKEPVQVNFLHRSEFKDAIARARKAKSDVIIMMIHWGSEYWRKPDKEQKKIARFLFQHGVDVIMGSHPHVIQSIRPVKIKSDDQEKKGVVFYSHGNFISHQRQRFRDGGIIGHVEFVKKDGQVFLDRYGYTLTWVWKQTKGKKSKFYILPVSLFESNPELYPLSDQDRKKLQLFAKDSRKHLKKSKEYKYIWQLKEKDK